LFGIYEWVGSRRSDGRKTVVVDRKALLTYVQYRAKYFDPERAGRFLDGLGEADIHNLVDEYVRQEVLYREALALGLDRDDFVIRQRLIQKLSFINRDLTTELTKIADADVERYFETHRDDYVDPPYITFTHVFFDPRHGGSDQAHARAEAKRTELNARRVPFSEGAREGDRFHYNVNYVERTVGEVAGHFGSAMAGAVFELEARDDYWHGPLESSYGYHLVMVTERSPGQRLEFTDVYDRVKDDARRALVEERQKALVNRIIDAYDVEVTYQPDPSETPGPSTGEEEPGDDAQAGGER